MSGVPLSFLAADSSLVRAMLLTHNEGEGEKHITLMSETETVSYYVSLLCTGWLKLGDDRYIFNKEVLLNFKSFNEIAVKEKLLSRN